jgi:DNA polymerase-3 subunit beta
MKLTVRRESFAEALAFASNIVKVRTPKPALTAVRLTAKDKHLSLVATDMEMALRWPLVDVDVIAPGEVLIPADKLSSIVNSLRSDDTLTLSADEGSQILAVQGKWSNFKIFGFLPAEQPAVDEFKPDDSDLLFDGPRLARMIEQTEFAVAKEATRFTLNALLFESVNDGLTLVATDGHRLSMVRHTTGGKVKVPAAWPIPRRCVMLLTQLLADPDANCRIQSSRGYATFVVQDSGDAPAIMLRTCMVDGTFPSYKHIIPREFDRKAIVGRDILEDSVKQAMLMTNEESKGIRMSFGEKGLQISSRTPERGEATIDVGAEFSGFPIDIGLNPKFLLDVLGTVVAEKVTIEMNGPNKPMKITSDPDAVSIIMPVNLL